MIACLHVHELDVPLDIAKSLIRERLERRPRTIDAKQLNRLVRKEVRDILTQEALNPHSTMIEHLAVWTDFAVYDGDLSDLAHFESLSKHPDLVKRFPAEFGVGRMLAAYCHAAVGSIVADLL